MKKMLLNGMDTRNKIEAGVDKLTDAVKVTLGAKGRNVLLQRGEHPPLITNDGVTIAKEIELEDIFENMGAKLVKEVAIKTNDDAGDGTTTATILTQAIFKEGLKNIVAGANPILLKEGIKKATELVISDLKDQAIEVSTNKEIEDIATISANDKNVGKIIAEAINKVGYQGVVKTEKSNTNETHLKIVEGMQFDKGYISKYMVNGKDEVKLNDCYVLITDKIIKNLIDLKPVIEFIIKQDSPLVIIAEDIVDSALNDIIVNNMKGVFNVIGIKSDGFGNRKKEFLEDLAIEVDANVVIDKLIEVDPKHLGLVDKITITNSSTTVVNSKENKNIDKQIYIEKLNKELVEETSDFMKDKLRERIAKLTSGIAIIFVGGYTDSENEELSLRIEDALNATKSAIEEGVVAGGGVALMHSMIELETKISAIDIEDDILTGYKIVKQAIIKPFMQIVENAGLNGEVIFNNISDCNNNSYGFDVKINKIVDMFEAGILDAVKVTRSALQNASSIACLLLTTEVMVCEVKNEDTDD